MTRSVCGYCSTGCSLTILPSVAGLPTVDGQPSIDGSKLLVPTQDYPVNQGMACPKGWEALRVLDSKERGARPWLQNEDGRRFLDWEDAVQIFCDRFKAIQSKHGPASVAFLGTGQMTNEEMALLGCLAKFGMGILHGDGNTRQCMATSVTAYKQSFGFDAPPFTYSDLEESDCLVFIGANPCIAHPILWQRVLRNRHQPSIVVLDPRMTETAMGATHHLPIRPKSDLVVLYGLAQLLIERGAVDQQMIDHHTSGFEAFAQHVSNYTLDRMVEASGIEASEWNRLADTIARSKRTSFWWTMGVNQSHQGVRTAQAIINLALMTGNIGRPGTGANSITGQCNAMGSRLFSNTTNLIGHRDFTSLSDRSEVASILNIPVDRIPSENSWAYDQILEGIDSGAIRGLWIIATNTAHSWIQSDRARQRLAKLDFLVVQDMYSTTDTVQMADLYLPAAGWGEKEGTLINSERRIGVIRKMARPPGQSLSDFSIFRLIAEGWGCGEWFEDWKTPESVFQLLKKLSKGKPIDITGVDGYDMLEECGGIQWPYPAVEGGRPIQERRLFEDRRFYHADGRARFLFEEPRSMAEPPNDEFPFLLLTGRGSVSQWHTQTRTSQSPVLRALESTEARVEMHPSDALELGLVHGHMVFVRSRRGRTEARLRITSAVQPGQLFMPMHDHSTNLLTFEHVDPYSRQPAYKDCAVQVQKV